MLVGNSSVIKIVVQVQIRLGNSARTGLEIEISPLFQTTYVSTKKITVEGMGVFFQFPIKNERKREKKGKGDRNM